MKKIVGGMKISNFLKLKSKLPIDKPFLVLGKGPSIENIHQYDLQKFTVIGLNEASLYQKCFLTHFIDFDVFSNDLIGTAFYFICPYYPHTYYRPDGISTEHKLALDEYHGLDKFFYCYNCSTWKKKHYDESPIISARFFSSEAVFHLLALLGVKIINTAGIDGGTEYHDFFTKKGLKPLGNGQPSFDLQTVELNKICKKHSIQWVKL